MKTKTGAPRRACRLILDLQGDDRQAIVSALHNITLDIDRGELNEGCSGGYSSGYTYSYTESDRPTRDEYIAAINEQLKGLTT